MADCKHWEGDTVNGYWLCAKCFAKLPDQPRKYYPGGSPDGDTPQRQEVILAPIAKAQETTLGQFIEAMALRLIARTRGSFQKPDAMDYAVEILRTFGEPFGSDDLDWTSAGAWELVDEDIQHWDADDAASN
ncbi:hypothetical protein PhaeoP48_01199 [Phaeobacter inhibens]|uniref:hypothetical protein n=1 Tax=Phaeobacter inhibens TaxID=221822 RepID=UPI000C9BA4A2|nr:hypothetical protein [Phaeobacter inhibens]AUR11196.1 hypothetical protein PhaeoP48_01199 [Phaeobacter inhibens]